MPEKKGRISMKKVKEIIRLNQEMQLSQREISKRLGISRFSVQDYLQRYRQSGLSYAETKLLTEDDLKEWLRTEKDPRQITRKDELDFSYLMKELKRSYVTKRTLWEEYIQQNPTGYKYSQFCYRLHEYQRKMNVSMRQNHKGGDKVFVDFGTGVKLFDPETKTYKSTQLFVATWGASNYTFMLATAGEDLENWIEANRQALSYFGCVPKAIVPDNLKSAVTKACRYEPEENPAFLSFSEHYDTTILPTRPRKPKDKGKVEGGVLIGKRWIAAKLRNCIFTNIFELNTEIRRLTDELNNKPMQKLQESRKELFELIDRPEAKPLPATQFVVSDWKKATVNVDYHIEYQRNYYSVPYTYARETVDVRATFNAVEIYFKDSRIASHRRSYGKYHYRTCTDHMPSHHKYVAEWSEERILKWAGKLGNDVVTVCRSIMDSKHHPERGFKRCLGILNLGKKYPALRVNNACKRALLYKSLSFKSIQQILEKNLDSQSKEPAPSVTPLIHENIRGPECFTRSQVA